MTRTAALAAALAIGAVPVLGYAAFRHANRTNGTITTSGRNRRYLLHVPPSYDPARPVPLVLNLHGFVQWPAHQRGITKWDDLADEKGFIVVYPMGTGIPLRWAAHTPAAPETRRDLAFLTDLIDAISAKYAVDPDRVYASGLSNGGGMAFALACAYPERIAALGTVAGLFTYPPGACDRARPVPLIAFHGLKDPIVPFAGGPLAGPAGNAPDVAAWVADYAARNGCGERVDLPSEGVLGGTRYTGCDGGADVVLHTVADGGHSWPGGNPLPAIIAGHTSDAIDATRVMWEFFERHPLTGS